MAFDPETLREIAEQYDRECRRLAASLSGSFMSDTKWRKLFRACCQNRHLIELCHLKELGASQATESLPRFPPVERFDEVFWKTGMDEVVWPCGFVIYRHIEWIRFPHSWTTPRGGAGVPPKVNHQDVDRIGAAILTGGQYQTTLDDDGLTVFGYA
ncbi:MAG: hypothetical protein FWD63_05040 [Propionibacteriaceae bacterium]|nr:hypothetical protein [Propionibacteriaceae bacterium]